MAMLTDTEQLNVDIGVLYASRGLCVFHLPSSRIGRHKSYKQQKGSNTLSLLVVCLVVVPMLLVMAGDVELNPGPTSMFSSYI